MNPVKACIGALSVIVGIGAAPLVLADQALAQSKGCMACHQVDAKLVGPAIKDIATKYKGDAAAPDMLVAKVKSGGVGTWGQIPMPPQTAVSEDDIKATVAWMLAQ